MRIRKKISFVFVFLAAVLLLVAFIFIYLSAKRYTDNEFFLRLSQRASIAAQAYLEEDELSVAIYDDIRKKHLQTLPDEKEQIYEVDIVNQEIIGPIVKLLRPGFYEKIFRNEYVETRSNEIYYIGSLYRDNQGDFMVILSAKDLYGKAKMKNLGNILITVYIFSLLILYVLGQYYAKQVLLPMVTIIEKVNNIRAKNLNLRLEPGKNKDEIYDLIHTFNAMLDRLETSFDMQSNFVNNASHELKNPLTAILGLTEITLQNPRSEREYVSNLIAIEKEALRLDNLVNGLLNLVHTDYNQEGLIVEKIRIDELLLEIRKDFDKTHPENYIHIDFAELPTNEDSLIIQGSTSLLRVAFVNLLDNALKFSKNDQARLSLTTTSQIIEINLEDYGIGIPPHEIKNIFEPFYRATNVRGVKGFGFGLPLSSKIIKLHGGKLKITSELDKGTLVNIIFPNQSQ